MQPEAKKAFNMNNRLGYPQAAKPKPISTLSISKPVLMATDQDPLK